MMVLFSRLVMKPWRKSPLMKPWWLYKKLILQWTSQSFIHSKIDHNFYFLFIKRLGSFSMLKSHLVFTKTFWLCFMDWTMQCNMVCEVKSLRTNLLSLSGCIQFKVDNIYMNTLENLSKALDFLQMDPRLVLLLHFAISKPYFLITSWAHQVE